MESKEAFGIVNAKVGDELEKQGFSRVNVKSSNNDEIAMLYTGTDTAYSVVYYIDKKHMVLRNCDMTEDGPDNEWKTLATWMFDPAVDERREAESIGNDFADVIAVPESKKVVKAVQKKKKKDEDGNVDPIFMYKRLMNVFPDLKEEINYEQNNYDAFRSVTFCREKVLPKIQESFIRGNKSDIHRIADILSNMYSGGDMDTRSIITAVILNSIDSENEEKLKEKMSDDLKKAWIAAKRYKGKKIKPEKKKANKPSLTERLSGMQQTK
ncbi:MAG: hypothetical protein Q8876_07080 [Bacillota bacterium]|nr:hypothetical protein [Bacillota bacterium]